MQSKEGKITQGKLNYEIDWDFLELLAKRMEKGKEKYEPFSWKRQTEVESLKQALFRHVLEIMKNNYLDDEQEYGHIAAATANLMMIYYQLTQSKEKEIVYNNNLEISLKNLSDDYPNDQEFGQVIRNLVKQE